MEEQRKFKRFTLRLPTKIETVGPKQEKRTFNLLTRDVSAGGAFFFTDKPIPKGAQVKLELILSNDTIKALTGAQGCLKVGGTVVRTGPAMMAIRFDENYDFVR